MFVCACLSQLRQIDGRALRQQRQAPHARQHTTCNVQIRRAASCSVQPTNATCNLQRATTDGQHATHTLPAQPRQAPHTHRRCAAQPSPGGLAEQAGGGAPTEAEEFCAARLSTVLPSLGGGGERGLCRTTCCNTVQPVATEQSCDTVSWRTQAGGRAHSAVLAREVADLLPGTAQHSTAPHGALGLTKSREIPRGMPRPAAKPAHGCGVSESHSTAPTPTHVCAARCCAARFCCVSSLLRPTDSWQVGLTCYVRLLASATTISSTS